ncbi:hypothetical protein [Corynebacterium bovis]|uniref:hypothetical protein n=1 Tax=Corynebacterium bovis TaxID=36808 RepID=UPI000F64AF8D|nr:hypothetical protein [Corynebacterium bovis]
MCNTLHVIPQETLVVRRLTPELRQLYRHRQVTFSGGIFAAYPTLGGVDICGTWFQPEQIRHIVSTLERIRVTPYRGIDREFLVDAEGVHLESKCSNGYVYIDDQAYTERQCKQLERDALKAARCVESSSSTPRGAVIV